jgi:hypothetical protein
MVRVWERPYNRTSIGEYCGKGEIVTQPRPDTFAEIVITKSADHFKKSLSLSRCELEFGLPLASSIEIV